MGPTPRPRIVAAASAAALVLLASSTPAQQCPGMDDNFEDNDTCLTAVPVANGTYPGLYVEKLDSDFYILTAQPNMYLVARTLFTHAQGDIDIYLWDAACSGVLTQNTTGTDDEGVAWLNTSGSAMTYVLEVQVWPGSASDCNYYDLIVENAVDPCTLPDDPLEDNDDCSQAVPMPVGVTTDLWVDKFDLDYYEITLQHGATLNAEIHFIDALADIDVILYDPALTCGTGSGTGLTQSTSNNDDELIIWTNTTGAPRTYVMEVFVWLPGTGDCNTYGMTVTGPTGPVGGSYCGPAVPNSTGASGVISGEGSTVVVQNDLTLSAASLPPAQFGYFLTSQTQGFFNPPGSNGFICLGGSIGRYNQPANVIVGPTGSITADLTAVPQPAGFVAVQPGETWNFQCWYRDIGNTNNFTDGLTVTFQ